MDGPTDLLDLWQQGQQELLALGRSLDDHDGARHVPACPGWTVKDVFAHQAGVAADLIGGRIEGVATDEWTERQVAERADRSLTAVLDEWASTAPRLVETLRPVAEHVDPRLLIDLWVHDQDVRGALARPGNRSGPVAGWSTERLRRSIANRYKQAGLDPVTIDFHEGLDPAAGGLLLVDPFEFARAAVGRRSATQVRSWEWEVGDLTPYAELVPLFGPREDVLVEPDEDDLR